MEPQNWDALIAIDSGREPIFRTDAFNAFRGVLNHLTRTTGVTFTYGMPRTDFLRALLWKPHHEHCLLRRPEFLSWSWAGWKGPSECSYWIGDMDLYVSQLATETVGRKRRRGMRHLEDLGHPESATILICPTTDNDLMPILKISSYIARFKIRFVRKHGVRLRNLSVNSLQENEAVGDHWTLLHPNSTSLINPAGECHIFEKIDSFSVCIHRPRTT